MTDIEIKTSQLNELIINGDTLKAMELFYGDNVIMQENEDNPRTGKTICLENERGNLLKVKKVTYKLLNQAIDNKKNIVFSEWEIIFIKKADEEIRLKEVSIQQWHEGKIIKEKFYYKDFIHDNRVV